MLIGRTGGEDYQRYRSRIVLIDDDVDEKEINTGTFYPIVDGAEPFAMSY